MMLMKTKSL